ncbi:unnamed protein product [Arctogadus glacialis]
MKSGACASCAQCNMSPRPSVGPSLGLQSSAQRPLAATCISRHPFESRKGDGIQIRPGPLERSVPAGATGEAADTCQQEAALAQPSENQNRHASLNSAASDIVHEAASCACCEEPLVPE